MKDSVKKLVLLGGVALAIVVFYVVKSLTAVTDFHSKYEGADLTTDVAGAVREGTYTQYLAAHEGASCPEKDAEISV